MDILNIIISLLETIIRILASSWIFLVVLLFIPSFIVTGILSLTQKNKKYIMLNLKIWVYGILFFVGLLVTNACLSLIQGLLW